MIRQILETDTAHRYEGVSDDLITLKKFNNTFGFIQTRWKNAQDNYPTLTNIRNDPLIYVPICINEFWERYQEEYINIPLKFDWGGVLIAGGSVCNTLINYRYLGTNSDVDIFLYGISPEDAERKVYEICDIVYKQKPKSGRNPPDHILRTENCITFNYQGNRVQIILRIYNSISEILHGFDLGSSAVGFDGKDVYFTTLSAFSFATMYNILDTSRRSTSYESRIMKYWHRGFNVILPELNIKKLRDPAKLGKSVEMCELPFLAFEYVTLHGNIITLKDRGGITVQVAPDYDPGSFSRWSIIYHNIRLLNSDSVGLEKWWFAGHTLHDILTCLITDFDIEFFYQETVHKLSHKRIDLEILRNCFWGNRFDRMLSWKRHGGKVAQRERAQDYEPIVAEQIQAVKEKLVGLRGTKLVWVTKNTESRLTSSFHPIVDRPSEWYGEYYRS